MLNGLFSIGKFILPVTKTADLIKVASNATNSTDLAQVTANITLGLLDCCTNSRSIRIAVDCVAEGALLIASFSNPSTVTVGALFDIARRLYQKCF